MFKQIQNFHKIVGHKMVHNFGTFIEFAKICPFSFLLSVPHVIKINDNLKKYLRHKNKQKSSKSCYEIKTKTWLSNKNSNINEKFAVLATLSTCHWLRQFIVCTMGASTTIADYVRSEECYVLDVVVDVVSMMMPYIVAVV